MRQKLFFPDLIMISESYNNLGLAYKFAGQLQETRICYETALRIREKILDKEHPAIAGLLSNLGVLYMDLGELEKSKDFHHRALQIRTKVLGRTHNKVGDCMLNLGLVHERCSEYDVSESHFQQAIDVYADVYPASHMLYKSAVEGLKRVSDQVEIPHFIDHYLMTNLGSSTRSAANHVEYRTKARSCCIIL